MEYDNRCIYKYLDRSICTDSIVYRCARRQSAEFFYSDSSTLETKIVLVFLFLKDACMKKNILRALAAHIIPAKGIRGIRKNENWFITKREKQNGASDY